MRLVIRRIYAHPFWVYPNKMRMVVLHQILNTSLQQSIGRVLREREYMFRRVFDLRIDTMAFDAHSINEERGETE